MSKRQFQRRVQLSKAVDRARRHGGDVEISRNVWNKRMERSRLQWQKSNADECSFEPNDSVCMNLVNHKKVDTANGKFKGDDGDAVGYVESVVNENEGVDVSKERVR